MLVNTWGLYPWFEEDGEALIHPASLASWRELMPYGKVFLCISEEEEWLTLQYQEHAYKVKPDLYQIVPAPAFSFGDVVQLAKKPETMGVICDIAWHHKHEKEMYHITVDGKKKSSRYFKEDFVLKEGM